MKLTILRLLICSGFLVSFNAYASVSGMSLEEAFQLSLKRSEDLKIQEEQVVQAEERISQARGAIFPTINGTASWLKQDNSASFATSPSTQNLMRLTAVQPLFRGFRGFAALRQQKNNLTSTEFLRDQAKTQLFMDVAQAYYQLLALFHEVRIYEHQTETNQKRLKELNSYRKIGRSREADVLSLQASIAAIDASIDAAKLQMENAWSAFAFLTGLKDRPTLKDVEVVPEKLPELSLFTAKAKERPDVKASEAAMVASEDGISFARGGHLPSLDLLGNYYLNRPGVLAPVKWDVQLALTFPIFQGGVVQSQVRQASSIYQQAELQYEKTKRLAEQQIELYYNQVQIETSQQGKQLKASELAQKNYEAQTKDSRLGLTNNIDVLTALSSLQDTLRLSNSIYYQARLDYLRLQAATAERPKK